MAERNRSMQWGLLAALALVAGTWMGGAAARAADGAFTPALSKGQIVYVPVYSHIYTGDREMPFDLTATLSVRNTDMSQSIVVTVADYYDSEGKRLQSFLPSPVALNKLASTRFVVRESDRGGGSGANFIVEWRSKMPVTAPIIEAVMVSTRSNQGISFVSRGQVLRGF